MANSGIESENTNDELISIPKFGFRPTGFLHSSTRKNSQPK